MAVKSNNRIIKRDKSSTLRRKISQDNAPDEIALRDEILELKKQIVNLKKANAQNMVKFRKYEDEAKRKDRQIEQLMDPRKNADIVKVLSTKGAAILMNLRDQNNALIQTILTKDMQIRRLIAEIKTSKLYGAPRKQENHKIEVIRLRNLLIKSQEFLKENINSQQRQEKSIYFNKNSASNLSPNSDYFSPREIEELRLTIQTLKAHIKYSNELLGTKNQEIVNLKDRIKWLEKNYQCKSCKTFSNIKDFDFQSNPERDLSTSTRIPENLLTLKAYTVENIFNTNENTRKDKNLRKHPHSAPSTFINYVFHSENLQEKQNSEVNITQKDNEPVESIQHEKSSFYLSENLSDSSSSFSEISVTPHKSNASDFEEKETSIKQMTYNKEVVEKLKNAAKKYVEQKDKLSSERILCEKIENEKTESSPLKMHDVEVKNIESPIKANDFHDNENQSIKSSEDLRNTPEFQFDDELEKKDETFQELEDKYPEKQESDNSASINIKRTESQSCETLSFSESIPLSINNNFSNLDAIESTSKDARGEIDSIEIINDDKTMDGKFYFNTSSLALAETKRFLYQEKMLASKISKTDSNSDTERIKTKIRDLVSNFSPEIQKELHDLYNNIADYEETEIKKTEFFINDYHRQTFDSSCESDNVSTTKQKPQLLQVEVEINSVAVPDDCNFSESIAKPSEPEDSFRSLTFYDGLGYYIDDGEDDDADVIVG